MTALLVTWCGWCAFCEVGTEYETLVQVSRASVEEVRCHKKLLACDKVSVCLSVILCQVGRHQKVLRPAISTVLCIAVWFVYLNKLPVPQGCNAPHV